MKSPNLDERTTASLRRPLLAAPAELRAMATAAEADTAQAPFRRIVRQADPAVAEEPGECIPALKHIVHGPGHVSMARERGALLAHPGLKIRDEQRAEIPADRETLRGAQAIDVAFDGEERVHAPHRLQRQGRDGRRLLALCLAPGSSSEIGELEKLASRMGPTERFEDRSRVSIGPVALRNHVPPLC